jgi:hypothetical protein
MKAILENRVAHSEWTYGKLSFVIDTLRATAVGEAVFELTSFSFTN